MRKFQIALPQYVVDRLEQLAAQDHRLLRQQAEFLLCQAIEQAAKEPQCAQTVARQEVGHAPARVE